VRLFRAAVVGVLGLVLVACMSDDDACGCSMPDDSTTLTIYLLTSFDEDAELRPHEFQVDPTDRPTDRPTDEAARTAVTALLHFTPPADAPLVNGWAPFETPIAEVLSVTHESGEVVVDLDHDMADPYPTADVTFVPDGRLTMQQLVRTVQDALGTTDPVRLRVQGGPSTGVWFTPFDWPVAAD
jgi:hypothetical protein